ncbi:MAG: SDR family NAD(P)-dependent oxidoreductase [Clostridia bacterium]|nr:SDR family NAD(P)-dependent oxidoreductase [Clostridia bacterium]
MRYALVTGCDHGIGRCLAGQLVERGYTVAAGVLTGREKRGGSPLDSREALFELPLDIASDESVRAAAAAFPFPRLDLLINNAGILGNMEDGPEDELDFDLMLKVLNVNALGTLRVTAAFLPLLMRGAEKTVVNISSEAGSIADCRRTGWFGYCMSKAANNMQGALIHNTLRKAGGRVIQIHPGHAATWMRGHLDTTAAISPETAAAGILRTVLDEERSIRDHPEYLDWQGQTLPW